jgi:DNA-binding NarL/FixJ family response regulator
MTRRVLIVDDHPIVRQGLRWMIEESDDLRVCGEAESVADARRLVDELAPDVVVVDLTLGQGDGLELVREVHGRQPGLPMLVLSMHEEEIYAERLLAAGAMGYIMKQAASDQLLTALRTVLAGDRYLSASLRARLADRAAAHPSAPVADPIERLSNRELQVLSLVGRGLSTRQIAGDLALSVKTVETHRQSIKRKLGLGSNAQLVRYALQFFERSQRAG